MTTHSALRLLLNRCPARLDLVDVGARWGANERWAQLGDRAQVLCFEPDIVECRRLNALGRPNVRYLPIGLADRDGAHDLHVTLEPACSSLHPPIKTLYEHYRPLAIIEPQRVESIPCRRLDDVLREHGITRVSALKLDTQGSELLILQAAKEALTGCHLVDIEVEFNPLYAGQGLFCDVDRLLRDNDFVLWRLENLVHYAPEAVDAAASRFVIHGDPGPATSTIAPNGQLFWAQAQYVKASYPRSGAESIMSAEAMPAAALAGAYGFWDLALELVRKTGDSEMDRALREALAA